MRIFTIPDVSAIFRRFRSVLAIAGAVAAMPLASAAEPVGALAMYGEPALSEGFLSLPYADPAAPKGGAIRLGVTGRFDSLKPWVLKGNAAEGVASLATESLMIRSLGEPFTLYCLICETVDTDEARSWVAFTLRPEARFSDGSPVTVEDVIWSFETLGTKGHPRYLTAWSKVAGIEKTGERSLRIAFKEPDRELALLMGLRPVLKKAQWEGQDFSASGLEPPIGSGAYIIDQVDPGRAISFRRNPDWWAKDLPLTQGTNNFDSVRFDYFADSNAMFEALKAGGIDIWREQNAARWDRDFDFPAVTDGRIVKAEIPNQRPSGMIGLVMNTRDPLFADWRVRQAMIDAFNFKFINATLSGGQDARITSYFSNSELAMRPGPAEGPVAELLAPFAADLLPGTMEGYTLPEGSDRAIDRGAIRNSIRLLEEAGWTVRDGVLQNAEGRPFRFEIVLNQTGSAMRSASEVRQIVDIYTEALGNLGMQVTVTLLDSAQYVERVNNYQYGMTWYERALSLSPGNEQYLYWGAKGVTEPGTRNLMGMNSPAAEAMIGAMLTAEDREDFTSAVRALDRVLTAGRYVVPVGYPRVARIAHSARLAYPQTLPIWGDWPGWMPEVWYARPD